MNPNILISVGTRPEIIKMAPIYFELKNRDMKPILLHTGQHTDMAQTLFNIFGMYPDYAISIKQEPASKKLHEHPPICALSQQSADLLRSISRVMMTINPSMVLVHGDTSSALMAAMSAFYRQGPIAHVEAGLRSKNEYNPFPEEKNRVLIAQLAQWHFAPTHVARQNLLSEGIVEPNIHVVGNTIVEAVRLGLRKLDTYHDEHPNQLIETLKQSLGSHKLVLITTHRRENQDLNIRKIAQSIVPLLRQNPMVTVVWPVHPNPKIEQTIRSVLAHIPTELKPRLHITAPLDYPVLLWVLKNSWIVMTDSGGIQEEAVAFGVPVLVLRDTTERPEIIQSGAGILVGCRSETILKTVNDLDRFPQKYASMVNIDNPYGDGTTSQRICDILIGTDTVQRCVL